MAKQLTNEIIDAAIEGFTQQRERIDQKIAELRAIRSGEPASLEPVPGKRKRFSAASRKKMALAQKARWAKIKGEAEPAKTTATTTVSKRKRKMSAAGRDAIAEATRKRWEAFRAAKAHQEKAVTKASVKRAKKATKKARPMAAAPAAA